MFCKFKLIPLLPVSVDLDVDVDDTCHVCSGIVGDVHKCEQCERNGHVFCGKNTNEEGGYGQRVTCKSCQAQARSKEV